MDFRLLGPVQLWRGDRQVALGGWQRHALLAMLLLHANRTVTTDRLTALLWGERPPRSARRGLQVRMSQLRRLLHQADDGPEPIKRDRLVFRPPGYRLRVAPAELDVHRFDRLVEEAHRRYAAGEVGQAADLLRRAQALWRGPALEDVASGSTVLAAQQARLEQRRLSVVEDRIEVDLALGRHKDLAGELPDLVADHPLRQRLRGQLMTALYQCDRPADALSVFQEGRRALIDELGIEPGPDLQRLHRAILAGEPQLGPPTPRDGDNTELRAAPPPLIPAQLPTDITGFVGRDDALRQLDALLPGTSAQAPHPVMIATITGMAGSGKTAVAVHWAHSTADRFPDGQLYVNLRGYSPSGTPMTIAEATRGFLDGLGVPPQRIPTDCDAQAALYRTILAGRRILVLLDNARDANHVRPLLPGAPGCMVLVTSRSQLTGLTAAEGAHVVSLDLLTASESAQLLTQRIGAHRVAAEPKAVEQIITRCGRLPLALALVAARAATRPTFTLTVLADELARTTCGRLDALTTGDDPLTDVRATFSWSYRALSEAAARLFRLLGLYPGPDIAAAAAASLAGVAPRQGRILLTELCAANLIAEPVPGRYTLHDLLRAYAAELTQTVDTVDQRDAATHRIIEHYLHTARTAALLLHPHRAPLNLPAPQHLVTPEDLSDHTQAMDWFTAEYAAMREIIDRAANTRRDRHTWQLVWTMADFLDRQGRWHERAAIQHIALDAARRLDDTSAVINSLEGLGRVYTRLGRHDDALAHLHQAVDLHGTNHAGKARIYFGLCEVYERQGRYAEALDLARRAYKCFQSVGDRFMQALALNGIGWYHSLLGEHRHALDYCRQALRLQQEIGNRHGQAATWDSLGHAHHQLGTYRDASDCYQRAASLYESVGDRYNHADTLVHLGDNHHAAGDTEGANRIWRHALNILDQLGHPDVQQIQRKIDQSRGVSARA